MSTGKELAEASSGIFSHTFNYRRGLKQLHPRVGVLPSLSLRGCISHLKFVCLAIQFGMMEVSIAFEHLKRQVRLVDRPRLLVSSRSELILALASTGSNLPSLITAHPNLFSLQFTQTEA